MSDEVVSTSVRERAKRFESPSVTPKQCNGSTSLADIGNNADNHSIVNGTPKADLISTPLLSGDSAVKKSSVKPALPPKPNVDLKEILGERSRTNSMQLFNLLPDGSENLSRDSNNGSAASSQAGDRHSDIPTTVSSNSECDSSALSEEAPSPNRRIESVVEELVSTEEAYLAILDLLIDEFPSAMTGLPNGEPSVETLRGVLRIEDLKPIRTFHSEHLAPKFKERLANWQSNPCISDIILKSVKFFKVYSSFVVNQDTVIVEFNRLVEYFPDLKRAVDTFMSDAVSNERFHILKGRLTFRFTELFRAPFNRLFHYKNLLERYTKELEKLHVDASSNPEIEGAKLAISEMDAVIRHLNTKMTEEAENKKFEEQLRCLRAKLQNSDDFFRNKELKLVREGVLLKSSRKLYQPRYVVIFDTHIIIAKPNQFGNSYSIKYEYELQSAKAFVDERDPRDFVLSLPLPHSSSTFRTSSPKECDQWVQEIEECRRRLSISDEGDQSIRLPAWKPDHMFTNCTQCAKRFTAMFRKHHCRMCGLVYCEYCSRQKWAFSGSLRRVCDICHAVMTIDQCPGAELPPSVISKLGGLRDVWETKNHAEKWYIYKDEFFAVDSTASSTNGNDGHRESAGRRVPYLREVIAASTGCAKSGYLYMLDPKNNRFISRWVVIEQDCLNVFEACQNTIALDRFFLAGFRFEGPFSITDFPTLKPNADSVSVKFVFSCSHENYNSSSSLNGTPLAKGARRSASTTFSPSLLRLLSAGAGQATPPSNGSSNVPQLNFLFGVEEDFIAEDWMKILQQIKRHSELMSSSASTISS